MNQQPQPLWHDTAFSDHDKRRLDLVHPLDWKNPTPDGKYHLVVVGGGSAGLVTAAGAAGVGARVALIERHALGGDCLNTGCVPSKSIIRAARAMHDATHAQAFGVEARATFDFATAMERMRGIRADISKVDSAPRFQHDLGVDVFLGDAEFVGEGQVRVGEQILHYSKAVIATGARASAPPIPGLEAAGYYTNETIFDLQHLPRRLFVLGGGPIGCELAQSFARFGSHVTLADMADRVLNNDDADAAAIVQKSMAADGVTFKLGVGIKEIKTDATQTQVVLEVDGQLETVACDAILVAAGRRPNVDGMGLENVGVDSDKKGVTVNARLQTTNSRIYACGDVAIPYQFTHTADATARMVIQNALFFGRKKWTDMIVPWVTYTDPEVAHVGNTKAMLEKDGIAWDEYRVPFDDLDRAILDGEETGYLSVQTEKGGDTILGATIVASHAGEMLNEISLAIQTGKGLGTLASVIHPYPTQAEAIRKAGDAYNRTRLTPFAAKLLKCLLWFSR